MMYKVIPLFYAANEQFKNTIRFAIEFNDDINPEALQYAVKQVQKRYPYFSVQIEKEGESFVLVDNNQSFVITADEKPVCLNSDTSNNHLLAFAWKEHTIWIDISHFICDGNGLAPLVKTLVYYYVEQQYGNAGIDTRNIRLVDDEIPEDEYLYPIPTVPLPDVEPLPVTPKEYRTFLFQDELFDNNGSYAYNLQVKQQDMMKYAKSNDGSPVSFVCVMLYKAIMNLYPDMKEDIIFDIPHEYRKALGRPLSHDCLARVMHIRIAAKDSGKSVEFLNTSVRGQIILASDESGDIETINGLLKLDAYMQTMPLEAKKQTMRGAVAGSLAKTTFGVSYTGNISWDGMEKYIRDLHTYAGENERHQTISVELFTLGDYFSICFMQPGKNPVIVKELIHAFESNDIDCKLMSEGRFQLPDYKLP